MSRKIDSVLDKLEKHSSLTQDGRNWLIAACDPFHDSDMALAGYPDVTTSASVVQLVKKQIQLTVPTSGNGVVTAGSNWDCSIALFPSFTTQELSNAWTMTATGAGSGTAVNPVNAGGLCINAGPQGNPLWYDASTLNPSVTSTSLNPSAYCKGMTRIIGMGFEVVNTTADIYKQGQITAWRMPSLNTLTASYVSVATTPAVTQSAIVGLQRMPPSTLSNAMLLFGSRSWAAKEGAYVVARQSTAANPFQLPVFVQPVYTVGDNASGVSDLWFTNAGLGNGIIFNNADIAAPFDISGVHLTGLSYQTTLTVNVRWLIERVPSPLEPDLVVMATPGACYDGLALELYCACLRDMPPGVMLSENPLGEWFRAALSKVADFAPKIGAAINTVIPGAGILGNVIGGAARVGGNLIPKAKEPLVGSASSPTPTSVSTPTNTSKVKSKKPIKRSLTRKSIRSV